MWKRFADALRCPVSGDSFELVTFSEHDEAISDADVRAAEALGVTVDQTFRRRIDAGLLRAPRAGLMYPIARGLPVMLPYATAVHRQFEQQYSAELATHRGHCVFPSLDPMPGERAVLRSFSKEWAGYRYDGVIWDVSYEDNHRRFVAEVGVTERPPAPAHVLEVGCGIGLTTAQAQQHLGGDAVGVDLSLAVLGAVEHYRSNPFLHFVQASAFRLPLASAAFDVVYSRGVLHHTYSTREAFKSIATYCKPGGRLYVWVYGPGSINDTALRRLLYGAELTLRPLLSRAPAPVGTAMLAPIAAGYVGYNRLRRARNKQVQIFTFERALHSARDLFS